MSERAILDRLVGYVTDELRYLSGRVSKAIGFMVASRQEPSAVPLAWRARPQAA